MKNNTYNQCQKAFTLLIVTLLLSHINTLIAQCPKLIWSDEFDGTTLDLTKWSYQIGDGCNINLCQWGNNELQWYTQENTQISNGTLKIIAKQQTVQTRNYTSSRIRTINKGDIKYGRIEARMKLPIGKGIWPAFWMLPTDNVYGGWPQSGEIDIMEYVGHEPANIFGTLHYGNPWPNNSFTSKTFTLMEGNFSEKFHDYALEWSENDIKWFIDGYLYATKTRSDLGAARWPFDQKFHFLLNLAVGGNLPGNPNSSTVFPQTFEIDYVRAYDMVGLPYLTGNQKVSFMAQSVAYSLANVPTGSTITWIVPTGATIASGKGTKDITVNWGTTGGKITATINNTCGESKYELIVLVEPPFRTATVLENFDTEGKIVRTSSTGTFTDNFPTPSPNSINSSPLCGRYIRNNSQLFDVMFYDVSDISNGDDFTSGEKRFYMDINTNAPIGTEILLQLENKSQALPNNYPKGRHSRFSVKTTKQNEWERLQFVFLDRPDAQMSSQSINQIVILFAPNTNTMNTYYFDNFEIYAKLPVLSTQTLNDALVTLSPNPVSHILTVAAERFPINSVEITDITGKKVLVQNNIRSTQAQINIQALPPGMYHLTVLMAEGRMSVKSFAKK